MLAAGQVVDAIAARITGLPSAGANVFTSRTWPLDEADLPAWRVFAGDEDIALADIGTRIGEHTLEISVQGVVRAVADLDDAMNAMALEALPVLFADPVPYGLQHVGTTREPSTEGEAATGNVTLKLRALYFTRPTAPDTILSS